jgi:CHAT domain-containing protein
MSRTRPAESVEAACSLAALEGGKVSSAEALALARRKLIAEERPPFYWAPFILIGQ